VAEQNRAFNGGGIWNGGSATISSSTLSGNLAGGGDSIDYGGGIYAAGNVSLIASTVTGNNSDGPGAGIYPRMGDDQQQKPGVQQFRVSRSVQFVPRK
jgi:hypothetical protein